MAEFTDPVTPQKKRPVIILPLTPPITPTTAQEAFTQGPSASVTQHIIDIDSDTYDEDEEDAYPSEFEWIQEDPREIEISDASDTSDTSDVSEEIELDGSSSGDSEVTMASLSADLTEYIRAHSDTLADYGLEPWFTVPYLHLPDLGLPAGRPLNWPHVINTAIDFNEEDAPGNIRLADGIATVLYNYSPHVLAAFLDLTINHFEFVRKESGQFYCNLAISRKGSEVRVSLLFLLMLSRSFI